MPQRFTPGSIAYAKDGRAYTVEVVDGGMVYCVGDNGIETEFPGSNLLTAAEWAARSDGRRDVSYARLRQSRHYMPPATKLDAKLAVDLLTKADHLVPGLLDFAAFWVASQILRDNKDEAMIAGLSVVKCREVFDEAKTDVRASLLASLLGQKPDSLASGARLGDNLLRAMVEKGLEPHRAAFEDFQDRPRR